MPDTQRSKSDLATLFANNTTGDISAQDLRDFLETMHPPFASLYISTSAETTVSSADTFYKAAGTTTSVSLHRFDMPADNRLRYTGTPDTHVHGVVSFSASIASGTNKVLGFAAYHYDDSAASGVVLASSEVRTNIATTAIESSAIHFDATLETNDYIEFHAKNVTDTVNLTIDYGYMFMLGMMV
jgi:hypothetical protein